MPADVKAAFDAYKKDVEALAPKLAVPAGGRGGGGGRGNTQPESVVVKTGQAKVSLVGALHRHDELTTGHEDGRALAVGDGRVQRGPAPQLLQRAWQLAGTLAPSTGARLSALIAGLQALPARHASPAGRMQARHEAKESLKAQLARVVADNPELARGTELAVAGPRRSGRGEVCRGRRLALLQGRREGTVARARRLPG